MKRLFFGAVLALTGLLAGCNKDKDVPCVTNNDTLADFTRRHSPAVQTFTIDPTQWQTLKSAGGATISIGPDVFVRADGSLPTGNVRLLFQEIYSPGAMVLANLPTMAGPKPLESGGEFNVRALEGNTPLQLGGIRWFSIKYPVPARVSDSSRDRMQQWVRILASGNPDSAQWVPRIDSIGGPLGVWRVDSSVAGQPVSNFVITDWPDTLGWLNCDTYWASSAPRVTVHVAVLDGLQPGTRVFLVPTDLNGVFRPWWNSATQQAEQASIPTGAELTAVVLRIKDGKYYFGTHRAAAEDALVYRPSLREVSEVELIRLIQAL